jgi:hypothetical protein
MERECLERRERKTLNGGIVLWFLQSYVHFVLKFLLPVKVTLFSLSAHLPRQ